MGVMRTLGSEGRGWSGRVKLSDEMEEPGARCREGEGTHRSQGKGAYSRRKLRGQECSRKFKDNVVG